MQLAHARPNHRAETTRQTAMRQQDADTIEILILQLLAQEVILQEAIIVEAILLHRDVHLREAVLQEDRQVRRHQAATVAADHHPAVHTAVEDRLRQAAVAVHREGVVAVADVAAVDADNRADR